MTQEKIDQLTKELEIKITAQAKKKTDLTELQKQRAAYAEEFHDIGLRIDNTPDKALQIAAPSQLNTSGAPEKPADLIKFLLVKLQEHDAALQSQAEKIAPEKLLLTQIAAELNKNKNNFSKSNIRTLVTESGLNNATDDAFIWLVKYLGQNESDYDWGFGNTDAHRNARLLPTINQKILYISEQMKQITLENKKSEDAKNQLTFLNTELTIDVEKHDDLDRKLYWLEFMQIPVTELEIETLEKEQTKISSDLEQEKIDYKQTQEEARAAKTKAETERTGREEMVNRFIQTLSEYKTNRDKRFPVKDKVSPADKQLRDMFIKKLSTKLKRFIDSGNNTEIHILINGNIAKFPGVHLQTTLYRITLDLMEPTPKEDISTDAQAVLLQLQGTHANYAKKIDALYSKIAELHSFGMKVGNPQEKTMVTTLAHELRNDVDHFVKNTGVKLPTPISYAEFKTKFNARAHSQDILMSKHDSWIPMILSVVAAATVLGLFILAAVALHSKVTTGQVSFFTTQRQDALGKVNKTLDDIDKTMGEDKSMPENSPSHYM